LAGNSSLYLSGYRIFGPRFFGPVFQPNEAIPKKPPINKNDLNGRSPQAESSAFTQKRAQLAARLQPF